MTDTLLIDGLEKRFTSHGRAAFRDISFSVGQGEFIALIGPSGCGFPRFARAWRNSARPAAFDLAAFGDLLVHVADLAHGHTHLRSVVREYRGRHDTRGT
jgi:ABC-type glutathione transport system ATPase component